MECVINECNLFPSFENSKSSYARSNYKCKILVRVIQIQVSETWKQVTLVNYASKLLGPILNPWYLLLLFNALFSILHTDSLVKMSNSPLFSRIFTLQSSIWFCFIYSFWLFLRYTLKKVYYERLDHFNHWIWKFSKFSNFQFSIFKIYWF